MFLQNILGRLLNFIQNRRPRMDANGLQPLNPSWRKSTFDEIFAQVFWWGDNVWKCQQDFFGGRLVLFEECEVFILAISLWESLMLWFSSTGGMLVVHRHQQMWQTSRSKETTGGTRPRRCLRSTLSLSTLSVLDVYRTQHTTLWFSRLLLRLNVVVGIVNIVWEHNNNHVRQNPDTQPDLVNSRVLLGLASAANQ